MYQNLFDSHTHSDNSPDGTHSVTFMLETAVEKGLGGIAITDHCECDQIEAFRFESRIRHSALDIALAKAAFQQQVIIAAGLELSHPFYDMEGANRVLGMQHYDFVLLSLHRVRNRLSFFLLEYDQMSGGDIQALLDQYFSEMLELIRWGRFDSLAHMSYPLRYLKLYNNIDIDLRPYREAVEAVLSALIDGGKALEVNTSGLFGPLDATMPPEWILRRYRELGGELVTIGSDAHRAMDIGRGVRQGMQQLLQNGYEYFTFYRDHKPVMLRII
jgi:histidinol-phosphatase (PHP family)